MKRTFLLIFAIFAAAAANVFAQQTAPPLETILDEAYRQTQNYRAAFLDLLADEIKSFEDYDKNGRAGEKTIVRSNFLVYRSGNNAALTTELRNVTEVNGRLVADSQKRSEEFLAELAKEKTLERELRKIQKEGSRYDKTWEVHGLTLNQAVALAPNLRPAFDFQYLGTENRDGAGGAVHVVSYRQTRPSSSDTDDGKQPPTNELTLSFQLDVPGALKKQGFYLRGKLWIDAETFQIRREERQLIVPAAEPLVLLSNVFEYQPSEYGILVPKTILLDVFALKREKDGNRFVSVKDAEMVFEYSKFRRANVEVRILDDEN